MVAALAALGTLVFLWLTVRGAQTLRRGEDRAHLLDLAADVVAAGMRVSIEPRASNENEARLAGHRFRAAIDATGRSLPACRALLAIKWEPLTIGDQLQEEADKALTAALDEIVTWLGD